MTCIASEGKLRLITTYANNNVLQIILTTLQVNKSASDVINLSICMCCKMKNVDNLHDKTVLLTAPTPYMYSCFCQMKTRSYKNQPMKTEHFGGFPLSPKFLADPTSD